MKLLLVEDNASMQTTLERCGMQVLTCGDGLRALALWQASLADAVLLEQIQLPMATAQKALFQPQAPDFHARKCLHPDA